MTDLTKELERQQAPKQQRTVADLIEAMQPAIVRSLGSEAAAAAMVRHYYSAVRYNPLLLDATPDSMVAALLLSAQVRLEPGPLGHVYLVPFKGQIVWMLGYTGIMELARRSERVAGLQSTVVHDADVYESPWQDEKGTHFLFRPAPTDRGDRVAVLVTWRERMGASWLPRAVNVDAARVEQGRMASQLGKQGKGLWADFPEQAWAKTGVRAVRAWLPLTPDAGYALGADDHVVSHVELDAADAAQPVIEGGTDGSD